MHEIDQLKESINRFKSVTAEKCQVDPEVIRLKREIAMAEEDAVAHLYEEGSPGRNADERKAAEILAKQSASRSMKIDLIRLEGQQASIEAELSSLRNEMRGLRTIISYEAMCLSVISFNEADLMSLRKQMNSVRQNVTSEMMTEEVF